MECQMLFSGENKKNISFSSTELAQRVVKVKEASQLWQMITLLITEWIRLIEKKKISDFSVTYPT